VAEVRFFQTMELREAYAWVAEGGIAIHRNFDLDGIAVGGRVRSGPAWHVLGPEEALLEWGHAHNLNPAWLQSRGNPRRVHWDVFGALARRLEKAAARSKPKPAEEMQIRLNLD
jgi:hypothetical protein